MSEKTGGPAFPFGQISEVTGQPVNGFYDPGMTLREYFAAKAMQSILTTNTQFQDEHWRVGVAIDAFAMADAMLAQREEE